MRAVPLAALAAGLAACSAPAPSPGPNLVLVVMDTVRVDHLSAWGYPAATSPFLEELAGQGTRFTRAWSSSCWTLPAHASMFTGLPASVHGADQDHLRLSGDPTLLAERLGAAGYQAAAFSNNPWVSDRTGLADGFAPFRELWRRRARPSAPLSDPTSAAVEDWIEDGRDPEKPFFLFVNLMEAHGPYEPSWRVAWSLHGPLETWGARGRYEAVEREGLVRSWYLGDEPVDPAAIAAAVDLYDAEIREADAAVERIVRAVDRVADPASTTLLVVTDHGEAFGEHGIMGHNFSLAEPLLRVAILARGPGFAAGATEAGVAKLDDVHPTLLAAAGLAPGAGAALDLHGPLPGDREIEASYAYPRQVIGTFPPRLRGSPRLEPFKRALAVGLDGRHKLVRDSRGGEALFDLLADPGEVAPIADPDPALLARLRRVAGEPGGAGDGATGPEGLDDETVEALEELGYLEGR